MEVRAALDLLYKSKRLFFAPRRAATARSAKFGGQMHPVTAPVGWRSPPVGPRKRYAETRKPLKQGCGPQSTASHGGGPRVGLMARMGRFDHLRLAEWPRGPDHALVQDPPTRACLIAGCSSNAGGSHQAANIDGALREGGGAAFANVSSVLPPTCESGQVNGCSCCASAAIHGVQNTLLSVATPTSTRPWVRSRTRAKSCGLRFSPS